MEEIEYKLKKKNAVLIVNTVAKLVDTIRQKTNPNENGEKSQEFKYLKQKCEDEEALVSVTASQGIVALVELGVIPWDTALYGFVASLVTARNYTGIITSIGQLLVIDVESHLLQKKEYRSPFFIRNPQHPMITVLKQRKDVWIDVYSQMKYLFNHSNEIVSNNCEEMLRPVILYTLCTASLPSACKEQTWDLLLKLPSPNVSFLLKVLSWMQVDESEIECVVSLHSQMCEFAVSTKDATLCAALCPRFVSLIRKLAHFGHDPRPHFKLVIQLLHVSVEPSSCVLILLSETVAICPSIYLKEVLKTCKMILEMKACNMLSAKMLEYSLLPWLVFPSYLTGEAVQLGSEILSLISDLKTWSAHTGKILSNKYFDILRAVDSHVDRAVHLSRLGEIWQSNPSSVEEWLSRVSMTPKPFVEKLNFALSALLMQPFDNNEVQKEVLVLLLSLVEHHNELSGSLLTVILYKLSNETEPKVLLELLRSLTQMAVLKENVALILHTLETMKSRHVLRSVVVDLYLRLWKIENRCYPYLEKLLQETPKDADLSWEFEIAKAAVIKEICETRPDPYSAELVAMISKILTQCSDVSGSLASSLALQGLAALCKAGIVDITTTWKALAPKLNRDKRPIVVKRWCEFMGTVPSLRCVTHDYEKLVAEVILRLWSYILNSDDADIVDAAFSSLSKFNLDQLTLKGLPEKYRVGLKLPSSYAKTPVDAARKPEDVLPYIPSECWVQMLLKLKPEFLKSAGDMLGHWLSCEVVGFHYITGRAEPSCYSHLLPQCICRGLVNYLNRTYNPDEMLVVRECLRILSQDFKKPLPPLNWIFLSPLLEVPELQEYGIALAAKQNTSPSARKVLEDFINSLVPSKDTENEILILFSNLGELCKSVPPNVLKPLIEKSLLMAIRQTLENGADFENEKFLKQLLSYVKCTLKKEDIHDSNRTQLSLIVESLLEKFDIDSPLFGSYVDCVVELHTKYIERMSSPSVWWEVTPEKLRLAMGIRTAMACRADTEIPLVWLNECIDATINMTGEHTSVLKSIASVMLSCRGNESNCPWTLELMGRIQLVVNKNESNNQQTIVFLCDVFILTVIILSGYDCLNASLEGIATTREIRLRLFPQALSTLLTYEKWNKITTQMIEWLLFMQNTNVDLPMYTTSFQQGIASVKHDKHFRETSVWFRFLDHSKTNTRK
ncbi:hypothetical protein R5R35_010177 [Gryllus longicercus]|uniref:DUF3730 domain-containing protein n=1 Tax=Gryllus longicercus TaxID=2509291 RepID=A0AAN9Z4P4_9ORTH